MDTIRVNASRAYDVCVGEGLLDEAGARIRAACPRARVAALAADETVMALCGARVRASLEAADLTVAPVTFPAGERHKTLATYGALLEFLCRSRLSRSDVLVALGGGVTGDMAGFAASTYLRGIDYVQIPTTLLSAVDSSVGGKTAVDLEAGKNQAGTFWQPVLVLCDPSALRTLPEDVWRDGCAEVIKYGMLGSEPFFAELEHTDARDMLAHVIAACVTMKRDVVEGDEFDRGDRRKLNLGHSIGHAVEACSDFRISHGCAVAIGMVAITRAALEKGYCNGETLDRLIAILRRYGLPTELPFDADALSEAMHADKKMASGTMHFVVPEAVGCCRIVPAAPEELRGWLRAGGAK